MSTRSTAIRARCAAARRPCRQCASPCLVQGGFAHHLYKQSTAALIVECSLGIKRCAKASCIVVQVLAVDALRAERVLTSGQDHTCRVWKVPEESQLIFRYSSAL